MIVLPTLYNGPAIDWYGYELWYEGEIFKTAYENCAYKEQGPMACSITNVLEIPFRGKTYRGYQYNLDQNNKPAIADYGIGQLHFNNGMVNPGYPEEEFKIYNPHSK